MKKLITLLLVSVSLNIFSQTEEDIQNYYDTIVYYTEGNSNRLEATKYVKDILIYVDGDKQPHLMVELNKIVNELNNIISSIDIKFVDNKLDCNMYVYFGTLKDYSKITKDVLQQGNVNGYGVIYPDLKFNIFYSEAFVNIGKVRNVERQKHVLREEITQSMGFTNDTYQYSNSIFYQGYSTITEYSELDKEVIKLFYN